MEGGPVVSTQPTTAIVIVTQADWEPLLGRDLKPEARCSGPGRGRVESKGTVLASGAFPIAPWTVSQQRTDVCPLLHGPVFQSFHFLSHSGPLPRLGEEGVGLEGDPRRQLKPLSPLMRHTGTTNHVNKRPLYFTKYNLSVMLTFVNSVIATINNSLKTQFCNFLRIQE